MKKTLTRPDGSRAHVPPAPPQSMLGLCLGAPQYKDERFFIIGYTPQAEKLNIEIGGARGGLNDNDLFR